jgi:hypothetical protein
MAANVNNLPANQFEAEAARYNEWRGDLSRAVHDYHDWLERTNQLDVQQQRAFTFSVFS